MRLHPRTAAGLAGIIPGGVSADDFAAATSLPAGDCRGILAGLERAGLCEFEDPYYHFGPGARLQAAVALLEGGAPLDGVAEGLGWRDFEGLAAEILESKGFAVMRNLVLTGPRAEIDVVGVRLGVAMLVDCKHWRRSSRSALKAAAARQAGRARLYVAATPGAVAVPVLVTLYGDAVDFAGGVPIVPVSGFASFVDEFYGNLDYMTAIGRG